MPEPKTILIVGAGDLACRVLQGLAHTSQARNLTLAGRNVDTGIRAVNLARFSAMQCGRAPSIEFVPVDLDDIDRTATQIAEVDPDIVFAAVSLQPWWAISLLPDEACRRLSRANFGPWLPMHLAPVARLMQALRTADSRAVVVNAAYPDAVHPLLHSVGLGPYIGIGNVANNVPALRVVAADRLGCDPGDLWVRFVAHHYVSNRISRAGDAGRAPVSLTFTRAGQDVSGKVDLETIFQPLRTAYRRVGGRAGQAMTAASALSVLEPLVTSAAAFVHAPGPEGLPGGYPLRMTANGLVHLDLPTGLSREEAISINAAGQREDGIRRISDGWVEFEDEQMEVMRTELGYQCTRMHWTEADDYAHELAKRYALYREGLGLR
jgi:hypothetical protein